MTKDVRGKVRRESFLITVPFADITIEIVPPGVKKQYHPGMTEPAKPQPAIRVVMMPRDTNPMGTIFGGLILSYIDQAGVVEAQRHTDQQLVTVAMHEVKFIAPVLVGDLVSFYAETLRIGNTSITVLVTVDATRRAPPHETARVTQAEVVYVAVDAPGKSVPVHQRQ